MAKAKRGSTVKKGLKFFNFGEAGTWKSTFALDFMKMKSENGKPLRVLYIDCEAGSVDNYLESLEEQGINLDNLLLVYTTSYSEVEEWAQKAMQEETLYIEDDDGNLEEVLDADGNPFVADVIVVDGITVISDNVKFAAINVSEKRAKLKAKSQDKTATEQFVAESTAGLEFKDHDKIKMKGKNLLRSLITGTDKYVVVTSREKTKKQMVDVDGKMQLVEVGKVPDTWDGVEYEFFTVLRHFEDDMGQIKAQVMRKDRTQVYAQNVVIDDPSPLLWQEVIDKNKGKKSNIVGNSMSDSIKKDEDLLSESMTNKKEKVQEEETTSDVTVDGLRNEIGKLISTLTPLKKKSLGAKVKASGLDIDFNQIEAISDLEKFLKLVKE
ncbi:MULTISPECIES: AAA family ATPase [Lysinibacillus]|uniref:AAA family ATPase n=1 Tax=Lysinibacillus TaxID=400634 RepID=UPI00214B0E0C|nr:MULTISPECIES: AAA family ATPase [Lysinibacillus]UUV25970.1 AAA family ATPase [Lysinibacillus sp. FN11]UYB48843.1 AAA family ATPase [Lysinibacillus capsici]